MLKELPKAGQVVVAVQDEYEWESDRRYLTHYEKYEVVGQSEASGNPYIIDDLGDKCFIDDNAFYLYELKDDEKWNKAKDVLHLKEAEFRNNDYLKMHSNYDSWKASREKESPFFVEIVKGINMSRACMQLNIEQAEQLRDYLTHKIDYLKGES